MSVEESTFEGPDGQPVTMGEHFAAGALPPEEPEVVDGEVVYAVVPYTGEAVDLKGMETDRLAGLLDEVREFEQDRLRDFKRGVQDELLARMDLAVSVGDEASWTQRCRGWTLTADTPSREEWNTNGVLAALDQLVEEKVISREAADGAIRRKPEVSASGIKTLLRLGGRVAELLGPCRVPSTKPRSVRVERGMVQ